MTIGLVAQIKAKRAPSWCNIYETVSGKMPITSTSGNSGKDLNTLTGSEIADSLTIDNSNLYIDTLEGNDTVEGVSSVENIIINRGNDLDNISFRAELLNSTISMGDGNDIIDIRDFSGYINGGPGDDRVIISADRTLINTLIRGDGGKDEFQISNAINTIINSNSDDDSISVNGNLQNTQIYAGRQKDSLIISGVANNSLIRGDANEDTITINGSLINTIVNGNADNDTIKIYSANIRSSTVYGGKGIDNIDIVGDKIYVNAGADDDDVDATTNENQAQFMVDRVQ